MDKGASIEIQLYIMAEDITIINQRDNHGNEIRQQNKLYLIGQKDKSDADF